MQSGYAGEKRGEIHGKLRGICPNQGDIQKVSGYPPKSERYAESVGVSVQIREICRKFPYIQ